MEKSESIKNLAMALLAFQIKADKIKKDATNPYFKKKYASLSNILEQIQIPLGESGLCISQHPSKEDMLITFLIHAESGEYIISEYEIHPVPEYTKEKDEGGKVIWRSDDYYYTPQAVGSALTYARRYAISAVLGLNIDDDDDGNAATHGTYIPKEQPSDNGKPWLNEGTAEFDSAIKKLKAGTTTLQKIMSVRRISKKTADKLVAAETKK